MYSNKDTLEQDLDRSEARSSLWTYMHYIILERRR